MKTDVRRRLGRCAVLALAAFVWLASLSACTTPATQITVALDTDSPIDRRLSLTIHFLAAWDGGPSGNDPALVVTRGGAGGDNDLPGTFALVPGEGAPRDRTGVVLVNAYLEGGSALQPSVQWRRYARVAFLRGRNLRLRMFLSIRCAERSARCTTVAPEDCTVATRCEEQGLTCGDRGECESAEVSLTDDAGPTSDLPTATDVPPPMDGAVDTAVLDAPRMDVTADAPPDVTSDAADITVMDVPAPPGSRTIDGPATTTFTVPAGVTVLRVSLWGAGGGRATGGTTLGGAGGNAEATLQVLPGQVLNILAGGAGGDGAAIGLRGGAAGTPGGGGTGGFSVSAQRRNGGGGGGRSEIVREGVVLVVAGGGGGTGHGGDPASLRVPGAGGGAAGLAGASGAAEGGRGGTATAGGAGGVSCPAPGVAGSLMQAGRGGNGSDNGGGGGGGGYFGGGGGCGASGGPGCAGGGGSGYLAPGTMGTLQSGSVSTPGNAMHPDRGTAGAPGTPGRVVLRW